MAIPLPDRRLRRARLVAIGVFAAGVCTGLLAPGLVVLRDTGPGPARLLPVLAGLLAFAAGHAAAVHAALTPWLPEAGRRRRLRWFAVAAVASVPLVGAVAGPAVWLWLGASIIGTAPLLGHRGAAALAALGPLATVAGLGWWNGDDPVTPTVTAAVIGTAVALMSWLQLWYWDLLLQLDRGRTAQAELAATEERLRFARDVHDLLGHRLTVIALKAELAARLAPADAARAGQEAAEVQRLAAAALADVRDAVHGYRAVDLGEQLASVGEVLRSCGVRCTVTTDGAVPAETAAQFAAVLREATTNVLRHSRATWCTITLTGATLTVTNDGAAPYQTGTGTAGYGLRGLAERLAGVGGRLTHRLDGDRFVVEATA